MAYIERVGGNTTPCAVSMDESSRSTRHSTLLSAQRIARTKPSQGEVWLSDDHKLRGTGRLLLRITPGGTHRFYFRYAQKGGRKTVSLGPYSRTAKEGYLTLQQARVLARSYAASLHLAKPGASTVPSPTAHDAATAAPKGNAPAGPTLVDLCRAYARDLRRRERNSATAVAGEIERHIATSSIAAMPARDVTPEDVTALLRAMIERGIGSTASRVRSILHTVYEVALNARFNPGTSPELIDPLLKSNPLSNIRTLREYSVPRRRALSIPELRELWRLVHKQRTDHDTVQLRALRLAVLLGGQRCQQLMRVRVDDVDLEGGTILLLDPKGRRTTAREHRLPLLGTALAEVQWLIQHALDAGSSFLFPSVKPTISVTSTTVSNLVTSFCKTMLANGTVTAHFQFSDLRRTAETRLAALGISKDVRAQLQSHGLSGVQTRHYDQYDYMVEKRAALQTWEAFLNGFIET